MKNKTNKKRIAFLYKKLRTWYFQFFLFLYTALFLSILPYQHFTDEYEQFTAGWLISKGMLPYVDFFSHHGPLPLFLGSLPFFFIKSSPTILLTQRILVFIIHVTSWIVLWHWSEKKYRLPVGVVMVSTGLMLPVFNLHMIIPTSVVTVPLIVLTLLTLQYMKVGKPHLSTLISLFSAITFLCIWSSIATCIPLLFLASVLALFWTKEKLWNKVFQHKKAIISGVALQFFFPILYIVNNNFQKFWWSVFTYNRQYYFPVHLADGALEKKYGPLYRQVSRFINNLMTELIHSVHAVQTFFQSLFGIKRLIFQHATASEIVSYLQLIINEFWRSVFSLQTLLALGIILVTFVLTTKKVKYGVLFFLLSLVLWFRDNELFHLAPIFLWLITALMYLSIVHWRKKKFWHSCATATLFILIMAAVWRQRAEIISAKQPYIDLSLLQQANTIEQQTQPEDHILLLNHDMIVYGLAHRLPASPYYFYFPWISVVPEISQDYQKTITLQKAQLILTNQEFEQTEQTLMKELLDNYQFLENTNFYQKK